MAPYGYEIDIRFLEETLRNQGQEIDRHLKEAVEDIARYVEGEAKSNVHRRTGNLFRNIKATKGSKSADGYEATVGVQRSAPYGAWVEFGTGIYGPGGSGHAIVPTTGNFLVFKMNGRKWVLPSVKGQRPQFYFKRAFDKAETDYIPGRVKRLQQQVGNLGR